MPLRRIVGRVTATLLLVLLSGVALYRLRNPEHADLDAAAREQASGRFVLLSDGVTHYDVAGPADGQRVVLVHGFSVPYYIWDSTVAALAGAGYQVLRYDLFGRGFSDRPAIDYTLDLFDRQLAELLDSLDWRGQVDLMGLSMGGPVTAAFTSHHPERVRSLTLVDPAAGSVGAPPTVLKIPVMGLVLWQMRSMPGMAEGQLSDFVEPSRWPDWPDRYRVQMAYRGLGRALLSTLLSMESVALDSLYQQVGRLGLPVLLVWGKEDRTVPIDRSEGIRAAIPQAQFHAIERAAHLPHMERTDAVNPLLLGFLRDAASGPGPPRE